MMSIQWKLKYVFSSVLAIGGVAGSHHKAATRGAAERTRHS